MNVTITDCAPRDYLPHAAKLTEEVRVALRVRLGS